jgi:hypothetical protein
VELHQVPGWPRRQGDQALRAERRSGEAASRDRGRPRHGLSPPARAAQAPDAAETARLQDEFARFARLGCFEDPLYVAISEAAAARPRWAGLLGVAPPTQRTPTLWLAALHDRLLELHDAGARAEPLFAYYRSLGGTRPPDAALAAAVDAFLARERAALGDRIATRSTQTNEIGRCAALWPILCELARRTGRGRIALLDVGCSAGLNLGVDAWRYRLVDDASGAPLAIAQAGCHPDAPCITSRVLAGAGAPPAPDSGPLPRIVERLGIDPDPIDVNDAAAMRWLRACLWPHDAERRARLAAAAAFARTARWPVRAVPAARTTAAVTDWLASRPADVLPVVFNSWVLAYFDAPTRAAHVDALLRGVATYGAAWVSAEPPQRARGWWPALPAPRPLAPGTTIAAAEVAQATVWTVALRGRDGRVEWLLPARAHAHGRWMQWAVD